MRITNPTISRNYTANLNRNLSRLNRANYEVATSGRKIFKMSDDTATSVRAMTVRRSLDQLQSYKDNAKSAQLKIDAGEQMLGGIAEIAVSAYERFVFAKNGTNGEDERDIIAQEFKKLQEELVTSCNGQYADRYLFGGTNTTSAPFSVGEYSDGTQKIMYNNVFVCDIPTGPNGEDNSYLVEDAAYIDVGLGLSMVGESQEVNTNTAVKNTINGLNIMGQGEDNFYDTMTELIDILEGYGRGEGFDQDKADELLNRIRDKATFVNMERTRLGSESSYLEYTQTRLDDEELSLSTRQDSLEFRDPAEAIMDYTMAEYIYNASLNMGSRLLQNSLFDYMR